MKNIILELNNKTKILSVLRVILGVVFISSMAQVNIPLKPVPITLQTVAALIIGFIYNPLEVFITISSYLAIGGMGIPVFANFGSGIERLVGPTAGYLFGMTAASTLISYLRLEHKIDCKSFYNSVLLTLLGQIIIFSFGIAWLSYLIGFKQAFYSGFVIFIPSGIIKTIILAQMIKFFYVSTN